jgi:thiamine kinase-like enzyme
MAEDLPPDVEARLRAVPMFADRVLSVEELPGGLTNRNYKVTVDDMAYVARLSSASGSLLAIDRQAEYAASVAAAETGVAPSVVAHLPEQSVLVVEWVEGRTLTPADLRRPETIPRIADSLRRLHSARPFPTGFDMFEIQRRYLDVVQRNGFRLPERYLEFAPVAARIEAAMAVRPVPLVPCNNDLLAANFIDDGERLWLIDYEYAGNNDPCFELGNLWSESNLAEPALTHLVACYFGRASPALVARSRLWALMSTYGWTLWAAIQDARSDLDFDFWTWGMEKYHRAVADFDGPRLEQWITDVRSHDD